MQKIKNYKAKHNKNNKNYLTKIYTNFIYFLIFNGHNYLKFIKVFTLLLKYHLIDNINK